MVAHLGRAFRPRGSVWHALEAKPRRSLAVEGMPEDFDYDAESRTLTVGTGAFSPVSREVWDFEVSGLRVLRSWLGYRMKNRKGRKSSPLDDIRPAPAGPRRRSCCSSCPSSSTPSR